MTQRVKLTGGHTRAKTPGDERDDVRVPDAQKAGFCRLDQKCSFLSSENVLHETGLHD